MRYPYIYIPYTLALDRNCALLSVLYMSHSAVRIEQTRKKWKVQNYIDEIVFI